MMQIPGIIDADRLSEDNDSQLSDDDEDILINQAAMYFGGGERNSSGGKAGSASWKNKSPPRSLIAQSSRLSKDASSGTESSASDTEKTVQRKNFLRRSSLDLEDDNLYSTNIATSGVSGMDQIEEEKGQKAIGSCSSHATSTTAARTIPSIVGSSISSEWNHCQSNLHFNPNSQRFFTEDEKDDLEVALFSRDFTREVQRFSAAGSIDMPSAGQDCQSQSQIQNQRFSTPLATTSSASMNMRSSLRSSITNAKKRRSVADELSTGDAAAAVASMFCNGDLSDDDENDIDSHIMADQSEYKPRKRFSSSSGVGSYAGMHSLEHSSEDTRFDPARLSSLNYHLEPILGLNASAMSAACAACAADEAIKQYEARLSLYTDPQEDSLTDRPQNKRSARRRAGFHVSSMEREASMLQADRMKLIEKDRLAARLGKRQARRSMSYTDNIRQRSSIIGITLPEDAEASLDYEEVMRFQENPDIQKLTRNRIQRRVNSMPDPNAISRLSNSTVNQNVDFSGRSGSALSDTLEASSLLARALEPRMSLPPMQKQGQVQPFLAEINQLPSLYTANFAATSDFNTVSSNATIGSHGTFGSGQASFGSVNAFSKHPNAVAALEANSILAGLDALQGNSLMAGVAPSHQAALQANSTFQNAATSLQQNPILALPILAGIASPQQNAAATLHANLHAVSLANQTELNFALQNLRMNATPAPESLPAVFNSSFSSSTFNEDIFDGKESSVISIPIALQSTDNYEVVMLLHEACKKDDSNVIRHVLQKFPSSARWTLSDEGVGNIALHIGKNLVVIVIRPSVQINLLFLTPYYRKRTKIAAKYGNNSSAKLLLQLDSDCALIRNNEGHVPLHIAVNQGHLAIVSTLCDTVPACARKQCENGNLPLHDGVSIGSKHPDTPQIIQALLHAFKHAVFVTNDEGLLPIHLSSSSGFVGGLRTLLASEFTTIFEKDKLEGMLPIDLAAHQLQEYVNEDEADLQNDELDDDDDQYDSTSDKDKSNIICCIEILLSSMSYNRLVPDPREYGKEGKPFLPLHSVIDANPQLQTWKTLFTFYEEEHAADVDPLGRNAAHRICSRPIQAIENDTHILQTLNMDLFVSQDDFGFVPLHLALQNRDAPYDFVKAVSARHTSSLSQEVLPVTNNIYGNFLPVQIAAASGCRLDVLLFLITSYPSSVSIQ